MTTRRRFLLAAFGDPGHAFPIIALGCALRARGHDVCVETWRRWQPHVEQAGMTFAAAAEYPVFPTSDNALEPYEAAVRAAEVTRRTLRDWRPDACVTDILTVAPAFAAELEGVPWVTLVPHLLPLDAPGLPPFPLGGRPARTPVGRAVWAAAGRLSHGALELGRVQCNRAREQLGLPPLAHHQTGMSRLLTLVATLPQLEPPRPWPDWARLVGPLLWEPPDQPAPRPGNGRPEILIAPSTAQDRDGKLLRAAIRGLAHEPVTVLAVGEPATAPRFPMPDNVKMASWLSYAKTMPACDVVVSHAGHGTLARALVSGCPVVAAPAGGDMGVNAARLAWAGLGVRVPSRKLNPDTLRTAVRKVLGDTSMRRRAEGVAAWSASHDAGAVAARELELLLERLPAT